METSLAWQYAPTSARRDLLLLFALDARFADIVRGTRDPLIGEMRLTWWRDSLDALRERGAPAEPLLQELAASHLVPAHLAVMTEGWMDLLAPFPIEDTALLSFAGRRGGSLFCAGGDILGVKNFRGLDAAGRGWGLSDFAFHCSDADTRRRALALALPLLEQGFVTPWPKPARPLGMIATLALRDARAGGPPARRGSPARQFAMLRHRLTGR